MKKIVFLACLFLVQGLYAQVDDPDRRIHPRDVSENDPSTGPVYGLKEVILQDKYKNKVWEVNYSFRNYFSNILKLSKKDQEKYYPLFSLHKDRYVPQINNGLTLVNNMDEYSNISDKKRGFCWGFATLTRNFNVLAFYTPEDLSYQALRVNDYKAWVDFYKSKIDLIAENHVAVFPGINNLRELSSDPELELHLKLKAMEIWRRLASKPSSLWDYLETRKNMKGKEFVANVEEIKKRIVIGESPKIIFSSWRKEKADRAGRALGTSKFIHAVSVYKVDENEAGNYRLWIWDANFYAETLVKEPKFIEISKDGSYVYYATWEEPKEFAELSPTGSNLNRLFIPKENDRETMTHLEELYNFCQKNSSYCRN